MEKLKNLYNNVKNAVVPKVTTWFKKVDKTALADGGKNVVEKASNAGKGILGVLTKKAVGIPLLIIGGLVAAHAIFDHKSEPLKEGYPEGMGNMYGYNPYGGGFSNPTIGGFPDYTRMSTGYDRGTYNPLSCAYNPGSAAFRAPIYPGPCRL